MDHGSHIPFCRFLSRMLYTSEPQLPHLEDGRDLDPFNGRGRVPADVGWAPLSAVERWQSPVGSVPVRVTVP